MTARIFLLLTVLGMLGCQSVPSPTGLSPSEKKLAELMAVRLSYAPRIAWIKYQNGQPISDRAREVVLLKNLEAAAIKQGVNPQRVRAFFAAQMAAFQTVQHEHIQAWKSGEPAPNQPPMDLQTEIRPAIENLNAQLLDTLANPQVGHSKALAGYCREILQGAGFSLAAARTATAPLVSRIPWKAL